MERNILIDTLTQYPMELENLPFDVQDNEEFVRIAVKKNGIVLQYASARLRDDYEIAMLAVKKNGLALQFVSERLRREHEIVSQAIRSNGAALQFVPQDLRNNRDLILDASHNCSAALIPEQFLADEDIAWNLIENDYRAFQYFSDELRKDIDLIMEAIHNDVDMLMYVPDEILNDKEKVIQLVEISAGVLVYISEELKGDKEIAMMAMSAKDSPWGYEQLPESLKYDVDILREFVQKLSLNYNDEFTFINVFDSYRIPVVLLSDDAFVSRLANIYECAEDMLVLSKELVLRMIEIGVCNPDILADEILCEPEIQVALAQSMGRDDEEEE